MSLFWIDVLYINLITIKERSCLAFFGFAADTFMESIKSSGLSVTRIDQGVPRGQINWNLILNADDAETYSLIRSQRNF
jgi:hypothetical protein